MADNPENPDNQDNGELSSEDSEVSEIEESSEDSESADEGFSYIEDACLTGKFSTFAFISVNLFYSVL